MKEPTTYTRTKPIEFSQLQKIVGGYIEMITLKWRSNCIQRRWYIIRITYKSRCF